MRAGGGFHEHSVLRYLCPWFSMSRVAGFHGEPGAVAEGAGFHEGNLRVP